MAGAAELGPEDRLRLLDELGQAVIATDLEGRVSYWNQAAERVYGWTAEEATGRLISELTVPEFGQDQGAEIMAALAAGRPWSGGFTTRRKDGTLFTALVTDSAVHDGSGAVVGVVGVSINVGEMLRPLLTWSHEVVVVTDDAGVVRYASPAVERVTGCLAESLPGRRVHDLVHPDEHAVLDAEIAQALSAGGQGHPCDVRVLTADGGWVWVEAIVAGVHDDPSVNGLVLTLRDVSERREALEAMTHAALHDPLTGLPNRALVWDRIRRATSRRRPRGALLFIDLDDFKGINDQHGHAAGDATLQVVAERLAHLVRPDDTCGRWAGDEFVVLSEEVTTEQAALSLAARIEGALRAPVDVGDQVLVPGASVGVAMLEGSPDPEELLRRADRRMYEVKQQHRAARRS